MRNSRCEVLSMLGQRLLLIALFPQNFSSHLFCDVSYEDDNAGLANILLLLQLDVVETVWDFVAELFVGICTVISILELVD